MEKWVIMNVPFETYAVSNTGQIKNIHSNKILAQNYNHNGYKTVCLRGQGKNWTTTVHRLVALYFIPNMDTNKTDVNHKDGNKTNNRVENLEWVSKSENTLHAQENGLKHDYKKCVLVDIATNDVYAFVSISSAANFLGVHKSNLSRAIKRATHIYHGYKVIVE